MIIGLDFGGVIANHHALKLEEAKKMFGDSIRSEADVVRAVLMPKVGEKQYLELIRRIQLRTLEFPLYSGVREVMTRLIAAGHQFVCVSTQTTVPESIIRRYLEHHAIPVASLIVVKQDEEKLEACTRARVTAFLDDNISILQSLTPLRIRLFFANFHHAPLHADFVESVGSWKEFEEKIIAST